MNCDSDPFITGRCDRKVDSEVDSIITGRSSNVTPRNPCDQLINCDSESDGIVIALSSFPHLSPCLGVYTIPTYEKLLRDAIIQKHRQ